MERGAEAAGESHSSAQPGQDADKDKANALALDVLHWSRPQDTALLLARTTDWGYALGDDQWLTLNLGLDIYNASDTQPDQNHLQWTSVPRGWEVKPQPATVSALATYRVDRLSAQARFNLEALDAKDHHPAEITFTNGFNNQESKVQFVLPVAPTDRLGPGLKIEDGILDDWNPADAIQDGPLVRMLNRPAVQKQELQTAAKPATVYTGWADQNFYLAFHLNGVSHDVSRTTRNFVNYEFRRAWGEDLCEILIQPIFDDGTIGPVLHIVCKPTAGQWVERKGDPRLMADPWQPFEGSGIRYTSRVENGWTGELRHPLARYHQSREIDPKTPPFQFLAARSINRRKCKLGGPDRFWARRQLHGASRGARQRRPGHQRRRTLSQSRRLPLLRREFVTDHPPIDIPRLVPSAKAWGEPDRPRSSAATGSCKRGDNASLPPNQDPRRRVTTGGA